MVYYRLNYYVKSGTVTDFAPYNFFYNVDTVIACKKPNTWYNLEFTYIFKLRNIQSMFTYMYIQHELQRKKNKKKKSANIHSHTSKENKLFLIPIVQKLLSENLVLNYYE